MGESIAPITSVKAAQASTRPKCRSVAKEMLMPMKVAPVWRCRPPRRS